MTPAQLVTHKRHWTVAAGIALAAHAGVIVLATSAFMGSYEPSTPEPVMTIELPPLAAPASPSSVTPEQPVQADNVPPDTVLPPMDVPAVHAPLPSDPVTLPPPPPPLPQRRIAAAPVLVAAPPANPVAVLQTGTGTGASATSGDDPKAKAAEADYFSLVSAHLNRKKKYPSEAQKAMQQGIVTVRFTVSRDGGVSGVSIKRGSGHELLDQATIDLMQRVAPLPKFPKSMTRDRVTLSLPIDYSLKTS
ncbi:hypothetical protein GCM10011371_33410 [Novosphingobium marinum]|uniref:Protein TonB n=1 Tax=Novosphingobium marinum TaxID=1514948 RepID=A0A7Y9XYN7_9SPHN|nr:energy transducer TonB [Novosphingobium marinum]NYH97064.1 protein TonB [Novosphingobium marinum]GGC43282.1 hypothetical protein GCM10011371_33410 [Novosphingobium marinum]